MTHDLILGAVAFGTAVMIILLEQRLATIERTLIAHDHALETLERETFGRRL